MVNPNLLPAIRETIRQNEIGSNSPYCLSFAKVGKSGASFGFLQGDTNVNELARRSLARALTAAGLGDADINRIVTALSRPLPSGNPLSALDTQLVDGALSSEDGRDIVDEMDSQLFGVVESNLDLCFSAANSSGLTIAPGAVLTIAPWVNMTGRPSLLCTWIEGNAVLGIPPPKPPELTETNVQAYLQANTYFQANPKNFLHLEQCVEAGKKLLPT